MQYLITQDHSGQNIALTDSTTDEGENRDPELSADDKHNQEFCPQNSTQV